MLLRAKTGELRTDEDRDEEGVDLAQEEEELESQKLLDGDRVTELPLALALKRRLDR
jgi:hypothetical protein